MFRRYRREFSLFEFFFGILFYLCSWVWISTGNLFITLIVGILLSYGGYKLYTYLDGSASNLFISDNNKRTRRVNALKEANLYLSPYKSIWKNLTLSNKHCALNLGNDSVLITAYEKTMPYRKFTVRATEVYDYAEVWNLFCTSFSSQKTYDDLVEDCRKYRVHIQENMIKEYKNHKPVKKQVMPQLEHKEVKEKIDINNSSAVDLSTLPGVSIVYAKKIVKRRDEIGGFKSVDDFFSFMKFRPHIEQQLRELICVNKKKGSIKVSKNAERNIDL